MGVSYSTIFAMLALPFLATTVTGFGPYSSQYGPYWMGMLVVLLATMVALRPIQHVTMTFRPGALVGVALFLFLFIAAVVTREGRELALATPMLAQLCCFVLSLWFAAHLLPSTGFSWVLAAALGIVIAANVFEFFVAPQTWSTAPGRAAGFFANPNNAGLEISLLTWLLVASWSRPDLLRVLSVVALGAFAILLTFSRGAVLVFGAQGAIYLFQRLRAVRRFRLATVVALAQLPILAAWVMNWLLATPLSLDASMRLLSLRQLDFGDTSSRGREEALLEYVNLILNHPLVGARPFGSLDELVGMGPHNSLVALAADFGILLALAPMVVIAVAIRRADTLGWQGAEAGTLVQLAAWIFLASLISHNVFYSAYGAVACGFALGVASRVGHLPTGNRITSR